MKAITFFNTQGGVGKTSLVYHLAWMYADLGLNVVVADLDPQANLTSMFLEDERLEVLWSENAPRQTVYGALQPLIEGTGDIPAPHVEDVSPGLGLVVGDLALSAAEDDAAGAPSGRSDVSATRSTGWTSRAATWSRSAT
jgi:chromosome partitioning protein